MNKLVVLSFLLPIMLIFVFSIPINVHVVEAQLTNYTIKSDGSIEPSIPALQTADNVTYSFTSNITGSITIERCNIIVDGNDNTLQGADGIYNEVAFTSINQQNVTIKRVVVNNFYRGFELNSTTDMSLDNNTVIYNQQDAIAADLSTNLTIARNNIANNIGYGVRIERSTENTVTRNTVMNNTSYGIWINFTTQTTLSENNITDNDWRCILLDNSANNTILRNYLEGSEDGIFLNNSTSNRILENTLTRNPYAGIWIYRYSDNNDVENNTLIGNDFRGVWLSYSLNTTVTKNNITTSNQGLYIENSDYNKILANALLDNLQGITVYNSFHCSIVANSISNNRQGIALGQGSSNNTFVHNNIINGTQQAIVEANGINTWDNGFEGNYWSNSTATDSDSDGIGDTPQILNENNTDHYPLMGEFNSFTKSLDATAFNVDIISNSSINDFQIAKRTEPIILTVISFNVTGETGFGFCRLAIPKDLLSPPYNITIDSGQIPILNYNENLLDNGTYRWIYFEYQQSSHEIQIIPEFLSTSLIGVILLAALLTVTVSLRRHRHRTTDQTQLL